MAFLLVSKILTLDVIAQYSLRCRRCCMLFVTFVAIACCHMQQSQAMIIFRANCLGSLVSCLVCETLLLGVRDAGRVAFYDEPASDKALGEWLGE
jgi:hypothetical protein